MLKAPNTGSGGGNAGKDEVSNAILIFLPGLAEILSCADSIREMLSERKVRPELHTGCTFNQTRDLLHLCRPACILIHRYPLIPYGLYRCTRRCLR